MERPNFSLLFGGIFSTLEEYPGTPKSPCYSRVVKSLTRFLELGLYTEVLDDNTRNWVNSEVIDDISKDRNLIWKHFEISRWFLEAFPHVYTSSIFTQACRLGNLELLEWLRERYPEDYNPNPLFLTACEFERSKIIEKLDSSITDLTRFRGVYVGSGHLSVLQWADEKYKIIPELTSVFDKRNSEAIKWYCENFSDSWPRQPLDFLQTDHLFEISRYIARSELDLELCQWLLKKFPDIPPPVVEFFQVFDSKANRETLRWLLDLPQNHLVSTHAIVSLINFDRSLAEYHLDTYPRNVHVDGEYLFTSIARECSPEDLMWFINKYPETNVFVDGNYALIAQLNKTGLNIWKNPFIMWFSRTHHVVYKRKAKRIWKRVFKRLAEVASGYLRSVLSYIR